MPNECRNVTKPVTSGAGNACRIMLVDDHKVVRLGFRLLLNTTPDLKVVAECDRGEEALKLYFDLNPDVVVLDLSMDGIGGLETLSRLVAKWPRVRVLVLSSHEDTSYPRRSLTAGAYGYLTKRSAADELIEAIREVSARRVYIEARLAKKMAVERFVNSSNPIEALSPREFEVFTMVAAGKTVNEIADTLFLSPGTVGTHFYKLKQKLQASNSAELTLIAIRSGLIEV